MQSDYMPGGDMVRTFFYLFVLFSVISAAYADELEVKGDGFLLPKYVLTTQGLTSFTTQTETAPTSVAVPTGTMSSTRASWQIGQSRFGLNLKYGPQLTAKLEVDFFNNNSASPEFSLLAPRLRIAKVEYKLADDIVLMGGQDWDIFNAGVNPHTYNVIGNYFQAGNAGFLRQQFAIKVGSSTGLNYAVALGMPQKNDNSLTGAPVIDGAQELTIIPTLAMNIIYKQDEKNIVGISGIAGRVLYSPSTNDAHVAYGAALFATQMVSNIELRGKLYYGQNMGNLNMLTLASGGGTSGSGSAYDLSELGGFITGRVPVSEKWGVILGTGYAKSTNASNIPAIVTSNILKGNLKMSGALDYAFMTRLKAYGEYSYFSSSYNQGSVSNEKTYSASMVEFGMKLDI